MHRHHLSIVWIVWAITAQHTLGTDPTPPHTTPHPTWMVSQSSA